MDYKTMKFEDIMNWCVEHKETKWLKETVSKEIACTDKEGNPSTRSISYMEVKEAFVNKFMPEIKPIKKPRKPSMLDLVKDL